MFVTISIITARIGNNTNVQQYRNGETCVNCPDRGMLKDNFIIRFQEVFNSIKMFMISCKREKKQDITLCRLFSHHTRAEKILE